MIWFITGTILYGAAVWLLLRFNHRAHRKPTPRFPDILSPYAKMLEFDLKREEAKWRVR